MPKPFAVRVLRLADDTVQEMPYRSFLFIQDNIDDVTHQKKFELVGEVDSQGNLVPGNPNLDPQHQTQVPQNVKPVVNVGEVQAVQAPAQEAIKKRRGRPAQVTLQETQV